MKVAQLHKGVVGYLVAYTAFKGMGFTDGQIYPSVAPSPGGRYEDFAIIVHRRKREPLIPPEFSAAICPLWCSRDKLGMHLARGADLWNAATDAERLEARDASDVKKRFPECVELMVKLGMLDPRTLCARQLN